MQPRSPKLLEDIRDDDAFIRDVAKGKSLVDYNADRVLRQAIERNFEVIGEAIKRLVQHDTEIAARIDDHRQIIAFRNVLIHGYDLVDHELVWSTIESQIPTLLRTSRPCSRRILERGVGFYGALIARIATLITPHAPVAQGHADPLATQSPVCGQRAFAPAPDR